MGKHQPVERPLKKNEYKLFFGSEKAARGWRDLVATRRNACVDAWEFLTTTPQQLDASKNSPLRGELGTVVRGGREFELWQHKPSTRDGARIWFYVDSQTVVLVEVHTSHPNATK